MPKIALTTYDRRKNEERKSIEKQGREFKKIISNAMIDKGMKKKDICDKTEICQQRLYEIMKNPLVVNFKQILEICNAVNLDFTNILKKEI